MILFTVFKAGLIQSARPVIVFYEMENLFHLFNQIYFVGVALVNLNQCFIVESSLINRRRRQAVVGAVKITPEDSFTK